MRGRVLKVLEAAYQVDTPDDRWFQSLADACSEVLGGDLGLAIGTFDASDLAAPRAIPQAISGAAPGLAEFTAHRVRFMSPVATDEVLRKGGCLLGRSSLPFVRDGSLRPWGVEDGLALSASDPEGKGIALCAFSSRPIRLHAARRSALARVAAHLGTSFRLRRRIVAQQGAVEAVLEPTGKLQDAAGAAKADAARQLLKEAVRGVERVRGGRRVDEDEVLSNWAPLLRTRWTLVDHFESDGRRYILARENTPIARGPKSLTARERQVVGYAALGHSSKLIAYELGIAYSTVRVLLSRAAAKLGAASREDLVRALRDAATR